MIDANTIVSIVSVAVSLGAILIGVGMAKADLNNTKTQLSAAIAEHAKDVQHLQSQIYDCIKRDQFDVALGELRHDIKRLIEMVAKLGAGKHDRG